MATKSKVCTKCGKRKPLREFYKDRSKKDGIRNYCKSCANEMNRKNRKTAKDRKALLPKKEAAVKKTPERKEVVDRAILVAEVFEMTVHTVASMLGFEASSFIVKLSPKKK